MNYTKQLFIMCGVYLISTVLFFALLTNPGVFPFAALLGLHAPYYIFLLTTLLVDAQWIAASDFLGYALVIAEAVLLIFLIISAFLVFKKKCFIAFGALTVISNIITICTLLLAVCLYSSHVAFGPEVWCSVPGNLFFSAVFFVLEKQRRNVIGQSKSI